MRGRVRVRGGGEGRRHRAGMRCMLLPLAVASLLAACGYRPLGAISPPSTRRQVSVEAIANETMRPGIHAMVSAAVLRQLQLQGVGGSAGPGPPDLVLSGSVTGYDNIPVAFDSQDIGKRFRIRVTLLATLVRRGDGSVRLKESVEGEAFYTAGAGAAGARNAEDEAAVVAARNVASKLVARLLEEW